MSFPKRAFMWVTGSRACMAVKRTEWLIEHSKGVISKIAEAQGR